MKLVLTFVFVSVLIMGNAQTTVIDSFVHDGIYRNYRVYIPAVYDGTTPVPLVLNLHGYTSNAVQQEMYADFRPIADTANFILVHPNGTGPAGAQFWNAFAPGSPDDIGFIKALIDTLSLNYSIDANRIYSCGMSNGGIMSYYMACNLNDKFAAIGSVTGSMTHAMYTACAPPNNMPVIEVHGTADPTVAYYGDGTFEPIDSIIKFWVDLNGCNPVPVVTPYANTSTGDGCTAAEYAYLNGTDGAETILVKVTGGEHTWPGAPITIGVTNHDFNASARLWNFFRQFDKSQFTSVPVTTRRCTYTLIYPNPASTHVTVRGMKFGQQLSIVNAMGQTVFTSHTVFGEFTIDTEGWQRGLYIVIAGTEKHKLLIQ